MKDLFFFIMALGLAVPAVAQKKFEQGKPNSDNYRYLDAYDNLKDYIDYTKYPNFKLGAGTTVNDYLNNTTVKKMINNNFTETVAGNAMKMGSVVNSNGDMNFSSVKSYVNTATAAGLNVYGHTLAWHSQQPKTWLLKLLADKPDPNGETEYAVLASKDFRTSQSIGWHSDYDKYSYSVSFDGTNGLDVHCTKVNENSWDVQFLALENLSLGMDADYKITITVRGTAAGKLHSKLGGWSSGAYNDIEFTTEWRDVEANYTTIMEDNFFMLQCGDFVGDVYIKSIKLEGTRVKMVKQTKQEMHDTLVYAMDKWIKGMMEACGGKVKAWDLVNEAISGGGDDGWGHYVLQHSQNYSANANPDATWDVGGDAFYWQDYMGDLEYVRQACRLARKYGPDDIVLFINDYNLESDWDQNKKIISLIDWIRKWELDGVTRIDGIGTQMHISYYEDYNTMASKKKAITKMFTLMKESGKLVRVSEMDMGYVDINGKTLKTSQLTETQHQNMAGFYAWIINEYLRIIPPAQQWGICQWCTNDANGGWRGGEPVGIWDVDGYRKHAYAGFVSGLSGLASGVEGVREDDDAPKAIYNLFGQRVAAESLDELPAGIYIINNRKVVIR
ncbi:MAG: endo-1,4-beta-xylanase [Bacteroidaceae bacterium]|nr:endo-1,4-beta-xylanase [Bacteroidaceae bacterium]